MPVTCRQNKIIDRLCMKMFSKKKRARGTLVSNRGQGGKAQRRKEARRVTWAQMCWLLPAWHPKFRLSVVPMPAQLCCPPQSKARPWALGYHTGEPEASQPCMCGVPIKAFERTNSPPCSLSSSGDTFTCFQPQDTWDPVLQRLSVLQGTPAREQSSPFQPMRKMSLCEAPPEAEQENFLERASLIQKHFFLPRGDFLKLSFI